MPLFWACGDSDDDASNTEKTITYKFNSTAKPTGTNNLIGVQIYKGTKTGSANLVQYAPYAYGIFDDFSKIKLELPKDAEYKIVSTVVVDGKGKVVQDGNGYLKPFSIADKGVALTNAFTFSSDKAMTLLNQSTTTLIKNTSKSTKDSPVNSYEPEDVEIPPLDRYYGETTEYSGDSGVDPVVNMERYVFGLRLNVKYVGNTIDPDNCILVVVQGSSDTLRVKASDEIKSIEAIYTYPQFTKEESPKSIPVMAFFKYQDDSDLWNFSPLGLGVLAYQSLKVLDLTVNRVDGGTSFDDEWSGVDYYYGEGE